MSNYSSLLNYLITLPIVLLVVEPVSVDVSIIHRDRPEYFKRAVFVLRVPRCCCALQAAVGGPGPGPSRDPQRRSGGETSPPGWKRLQNFINSLPQWYEDCT